MRNTFLLSAIAGLTAGCASVEPGMVSYTEENQTRNCSGLHTEPHAGNRGFECADVTYPIMRSVFTVQITEAAPEGNAAAQAALQARREGPACTERRAALRTVQSGLTTLRGGVSARQTALQDARAPVQMLIANLPDEITTVHRGQLQALRIQNERAEAHIGDIEEAARQLGLARQRVERTCTAPTELSVSVTNDQVVDEWVDVLVPTSVWEGLHFNYDFDTEGRLTQLANLPTASIGTISTSVGQGLGTLAAFSIGFSDGGAFDSVRAASQSPTSNASDVFNALRAGPDALVSLDPSLLALLADIPISTRAELVTEAEDQRSAFLADLVIANSEAELAANNLRENTYPNDDEFPAPDDMEVRPLLPLTVTFDPTNPDDMLNAHLRLWMARVPIAMHLAPIDHEARSEHSVPASAAGIIYRDAIDYRFEIVQLSTEEVRAISQHLVGSSDADRFDDVACVLDGLGLEANCPLAIPTVLASRHSDVVQLTNEGPYRVIPVSRSLWTDIDTTINFANGRLAGVDVNRGAPGAAPIVALGNLLNGFVTSLTGRTNDQKGLLEAQANLLDAQASLIASQAALEEARRAAEEADNDESETSD